MPDVLIVVTMLRNVTIALSIIPNIWITLKTAIKN